MATIAKFYLHDVVSPNTGTMPSNNPAVAEGGVSGTGTSATGNATARDATDVIGTSATDIKSTITAQAAATFQRLGHRRFVSRPLAAQTFALADGNWTFNYARSESNTNHSVSTVSLMQCIVYLWRPTTGLQVGTALIGLHGSGLGVTSETHDSVTATWNGTQAILDGDILVFDISSEFTQAMSTAYTDSFSYDGTTEGSTTTSASFVSPPSPITLFGAPAVIQPTKPNIVGQAVKRSVSYCKRHSGIWVPEDFKKRILVPA